MSKQSLFICPVCSSVLLSNDHTFNCHNGHSFDISKQGYVNLLLSNKSGSHGDDRLMVKARQSFLEKGYYDKMRQCVNNILGKGNTVLDAGCGEGYYTKLFAENNNVYGIDISKEALKIAARKIPNANFAVASIYQLPFNDNSFDVAINIFAPDCKSEFLRILKPNGRLILVTPMENHLIELKSSIYDKPYTNKYVNPEREGFTVKSHTEVKYEVTLNCNEDIVSLFKMTPYYYNTSQDDIKKLDKLDTLNVTLEFLITEYERI